MSRRFQRGLGEWLRDEVVAVAVSTFVLIGASAAPAMAGAAASCRSTPPLTTLEMTQPINLGQLKLQVLHYVCSGAYDSQIANIVSEATAYVERRASEVAKPALVLDIDETSLSNFPEIIANDFGYIEKGNCDAPPEGPCGWRKWVERADAPAIDPTLTLFRAAKEKGVAVFFVTGRRDSESQRSWTIKNLQAVGYDGWAGLSLRPIDDHASSVIPYKSGERSKIAAHGYTIIANIGDQHSDLAGDFAERAWKLPNPFYFIP
jgi:acid phosphatase